MSIAKRKKTKIFADYGISPYAWSVGEDGISGPYSHYFPDNPEIVQLDQEFEKWSIWYQDSGSNAKMFPWTQFNKQGLALAKRLAMILDAYDIDVIYCRSGGDPYEHRWSRKGYSLYYCLIPDKNTNGKPLCRVKSVKELFPETSEPLLLSLLPPKTVLFLRQQ